MKEISNEFKRKFGEKMELHSQNCLDIGFVTGDERINEVEKLVIDLYNPNTETPSKEEISI